MAEHEWQAKYGNALGLLEEERDAMLENETYKTPKDLFSWAEEVSKKTISISPACDGGELSLLVCDKIALIDSGDKYLNGIVGYGKSLGMISHVQTESLRYTAAVVLSMYLDSKGLGSFKPGKVVE